MSFCSYGQTIPESYLNYETGIAVALERNRFTVTTIEHFSNSCLAIEHKLKTGTVISFSDTITLLTTDGQTLRLRREGEETLTSIDFDMVPAGYKFYAGTKFYANGRVKEQGSWQDGKKSGLWMYWNEEGEVINKRIYKRGIIKKENYKFRWERKGKYALHSFSVNSTYTGEVLDFISAIPWRCMYQTHFFVKPQQSYS